MMNETPMTCDDFNAALPDLLGGTADASTRDRADAHLQGCTECAALFADLKQIRAEAGKLPLLTPSHDLWSNIESRIEAPVVQLPFAASHAGSDITVVHSAPVIAPVIGSAIRTPARTRTRARWQLAAAATILIAATAGVTWSVAQRSTMNSVAELQSSDTGFAAAMAGTKNMRNVSRPSLNQTYESEISVLRKIVDERRADLDSTTIVVLERNLRVIDDAIAESKAALAANPQSAFLIDMLADAYDTKLRTLRAIAAMPLRG